jgi:hypothetical protein
MKKSSGFRILSMLLIGMMMLLSCHMHPHHFLGEDEHCQVCQLLNSGFICVFSFAVTLLLLLVGLIRLAPARRLLLLYITECNGRAPPTYF